MPAIRVIAMAGAVLVASAAMAVTKHNAWPAAADALRAVLGLEG